MGKKRIQKQTNEEVLKEKEVLESAQRKATRAGEQIGARREEEGVAYVQSSYNNTLVSVTDRRGNMLAWSSAGALGFKGPKKSTPFAATKVAEAIAEKTKKYGIRKISVFVRGIGSGREAAVRGLGNSGFEILAIKDITPVPHDGCRPRKARRV